MTSSDPPEPLRYVRSLDALPDVFDQLDAFISREVESDSAAFALRLAVEEVFTNMVRHNPGGAGQLAVGLKAADERVVVTLVDEDAAPFDPRAHPTVDTGAALEDRELGGLGIHLVKSFMDSIEYAFDQGRSTITMVKSIVDSD